ncbi:unnamed protein product [Ilex paraguariensis]|uniref:Uncharacterized protein n=1 Tax=Ilex paraguariensis TaxID=185542 RepID=A0ABC8US79_9AQUA
MVHPKLLVHFSLTNFTIEFIRKIIERRIGKAEGMRVPSMLDGIRKQSTLLAYNELASVTFEFDPRIIVRTYPALKIKRFNLKQGMLESFMCNSTRHESTSDIKADITSFIFTTLVEESVGV